MKLREDAIWQASAIAFFGLLRFMTAVAWLLLTMWALVLATGCGASPPLTISVDATLPEGVHVAAARMVDAWCAVSDRTHWCPEIIEPGGAEAEISMGHWKTEIDLASDSPGGAAHNQQALAIEISQDLIEAGMIEADYWTGILTHEGGHFGMGHDEKSALMHARFETPADVPWEVDAEAVEAWCKDEGC